MTQILESERVVKGKNYQASGLFAALKDAPLGWGKKDNWRIAREMRREDLEQTDIGQFLARI
jgi:hypothetical protein